MFANTFEDRWNGEIPGKAQPNKTDTKTHKVGIVLGAAESVISNFPSKKIPDPGDFTSDFY